MELVAIALARVVSLVQLSSWDPFGRTTTLEALKKLGDKYTFTKYPRTFEEINIQKGLEFIEGKFEDVIVDKITIYTDGAVIDTRSSTDNSARVLADLLRSVDEAFGAKIVPTRTHFVSNIIFRSDLNLLTLNPAFNNISATLTEKVSSNLRQDYQFEPTGITVSVDLSNTKVTPAAFSIERRADVPFSENTYFSSAPLRTDDHIEMVKEFESAILSQSTSR